MKLRVKLANGGFSPWFSFIGDVQTAALSSPYVDSEVYPLSYEVALSTMDEVRKERDKRVTETDWTQTLDCPLSDEKKAEFAAYRQSLRDIPQNFDDPDAVVWPEKPTP